MTEITLREDHSPVLVVEDSDEDYVILLRIARGLINRPIIRCTSGDDALDRLLRRNRYEDEPVEPLPSLIVLDLNLPGTDGRDVLLQLKQHPRLRGIPVVIMTTSTSPRDVRLCYDRGAAGYITKVLNRQRFTADIQTLSAYWFHTVTLPTNEG